MPLSFNETNTPASNNSTGIELPPWTMDLIKDEEQLYQLYLATPRSSISPTESVLKNVTCVEIPKDTNDTNISDGMSVKKRQSHNKIERKYRMNINSKIAKLQSLVPWMENGDVAFTTSDSITKHNFKLAKSAGKRLNKSTILDMVIEYVTHLKEENSRQAVELQCLKHNNSLTDVKQKHSYLEDLSKFDI